MISKRVMSRALAMPGTRDEIVKRVLNNFAKSDISLRKSNTGGNDMRPTVFLLIRRFSDKVAGTFDTTEAVFVDRDEAELVAVEKNEAAEHPSCKYHVEPMAITQRKDAAGMTKADWDRMYRMEVSP